jgi:hypothetical protein
VNLDSAQLRQEYDQSEPAALTATSSDLNINSPFQIRQDKLKNVYLITLGGFIDVLEKEGSLKPSAIDRLNTALVKTTNREIDLSTCTEDEYLVFLTSCYADYGKVLLKVLEGIDEGYRGDVLFRFDLILRDAAEDLGKDNTNAFKILFNTILSLQEKPQEEKLASVICDIRIELVKSDSAGNQLPPIRGSETSSEPSFERLDRAADLVDMDELVGRKSSGKLGVL